MEGLHAAALARLPLRAPSDALRPAPRSCRHARSLSIFREGLEAFHKAYPFLVRAEAILRAWDRRVGEQA